MVMVVVVVILILRNGLHSILCHVQKVLLLVNCVTSVRSESLPFCNLVLPLNPGKNRSSVENANSPAEDEKER